MLIYIFNYFLLPGCNIKYVIEGICHLLSLIKGEDTSKHLAMLIIKYILNIKQL